MAERMMSELDSQGAGKSSGQLAYEQRQQTLNETASLDHNYVLGQALAIYNERSQMYGDAWRRYGALNNLIRAATKLERLVAMFWHGSEGPPLEELSVDDAYDAINYLVFFIIQAKKGEWRRG